MGGYGSGRHSNNTDRETDFAAVNIRHVAGAARNDRLALVCTWRGQTAECPVAVAWTPCHYGGARPWFVCPACGRRAGLLYASGWRLACRKCTGFRYESQYSSAAGIFNKLDRIRTRLENLGLQYRTRRRLEAQLAVEMARLGVHIDSMEARLAGFEMGLNRK